MSLPLFFWPLESRSSRELKYSFENWSFYRFVTAPFSYRLPRPLLPTHFGVVPFYGRSSTGFKFGLSF